MRAATGINASFFNMPLLQFLLFAEEMSSQRLLDLIGADALLAFRFFGRPFPRITSIELAAAKRTVESAGIAQTADVMLLLLEREFGLTSNEAFIDTLQQFRATLKADFGAWRTTGAGKTVAGVTELFNRMFFAPAPDSEYLLVPPLVFAWTGDELEWRSYISHVYASDTAEWRKVALVIPPDEDPASMIGIPRVGKPRIWQTERKVVTRIQVPEAPNAGYFILADDASMDGARITIPRFSYLPSLYSKQRKDSGALYTRIYDTGISYVDAEGSVDVPWGFATAYNVDYESVVVFTRGAQIDESGFFCVAYRCVPTSFDKNASPVVGQLFFTDADVDQVLVAERLDRVRSDEPFTVAVLWADRNRDFYLTVIEANADGSLFIKAWFSLPPMEEDPMPGFEATGTFRLYMAGSVDAICVREFPSDREGRAEILVMEIETGALTLETWNSEAPLRRLFGRSDGRRPYVGTPTIKRMPNPLRLI
jgi:hypothetical protein